MHGFRGGLGQSTVFLEKIITPDDQEDRDTGHDDRPLHGWIGSQNVEKTESNVGLEKLYKRSSDPHRNPGPDTPAYGRLSNRNIDRSEWNRPKEAAKPAPEEMRHKSQMALISSFVAKIYN